MVLLTFKKTGPTNDRQTVKICILSDAVIICGGMAPNKELGRNNRADEDEEDDYR